MKTCYEFCKDCNCEKYVAVRDEALRTCSSAFDAVFDVQYFITDCVKTCEKYKAYTEDQQQKNAANKSTLA